MLLELSKCVVTRERSVILNQDALDFLKALDNIDLYVGVPNAVDEHLYAIICRHRRLKIESEIKVRANRKELTEGMKLKTTITGKSRSNGYNGR